MYSYKSPREKPLFDKTTKIWLIFLSLTFISLFGYGIYLYQKASSHQNSLLVLQEKEKNIKKSVNGLKKELNRLNKEVLFYTKVTKSNELLNRSMKNLFSLVPDQIVLSKIEMKQDLLRLEGLTLTKDAYRLLLEPPLKSIFADSKATFKFNPYIGKYKFVSINRAKEDLDEFKKQ